MPRKTENRRLWLTAGLLLAYMLLAGALMRFALAPGLRIEPAIADTIDTVFSTQERSRNPLGGEAVGLVVSITAGLAILLFIVGLLRRESRLSTIMAVVIGAAVALLLAGLVRGPQVVAPPVIGEGLAGESDVEVGPSETLSPEDAIPEFAQRDPGSWWWSIVVVAVAGVGLFFVLRPYLRQRSGTGHAGIGDVAHGAADALEAGGSLPDVIQRCYHDMVKTLESTRHVRRRVSMTVREFEDRLTGEGVAVADVRGLTRLFELSRYSAQAIGEDEERAAIEHLRGIARSLEAPG